MRGLTLADRYRLDGLIGRGGMGEVWRAHDLALDRAVAVKVIVRPGDDKLALRLRAEARAAAALSDPHVVSVHDVGEAAIQGRPVVYLVMELVDGHALGSAAGPAPVEDVVRWGLQICEGLQAAHRAGVVHRDIKPANVLLTTAGRIKICDFGIARQTGFQGLTTTGLAIGTPAYMSPEQARGEEVDARSDLYSLGCLLYELLTGEPPFTGAGWEVYAQHANEQPVPLRSRRPEVPAALDRLVLKLLSKSPVDRPASAALTGAELGTALDGPRNPYERTTRPAPPTAPRPEPGRNVVRAPDSLPLLKVSPGALWVGSLTPGAMVAGQLLAFTTLSAVWSCVLGLVVVVVHLVGVAIEPDGEPISLLGGLIGLGAGLAVMGALLFASPVPWWKAILAGLITGPILMITASFLRKAIAALSRAKEAAYVANDTGLINGVVAAWLLVVRTDLPAAAALGCGLAVWAAAALALGFLLPPRAEPARAG